jgi:hypothetical protein
VDRHAGRQHAARLVGRAGAGVAILDALTRPIPVPALRATVLAFAPRTNAPAWLARRITPTRWG